MKVIREFGNGFVTARRVRLPWLTGWKVVAVEVWDDPCSYPVGSAWLVWQKWRPEGPHVNNICVSDQFRRHGYGKEMMLAILERWPNATYTAVTDEGEALVASVERELGQSETQRAYEAIGR